MMTIKWFYYENVLLIIVQYVYKLNNYFQRNLLTLLIIFKRQKEPYYRQAIAIVKLFVLIKYLFY